MLLESMPNYDLAIYAVHAGFWTAFGVTRMVVQRRGPPGDAQAESAPHADSEASAPYSRSLLVVHALAFGVMYFGLGNAVIPNRVPLWFPGQRLVGFIVIAAGAALMSWALVWFRSWRFRAKVDRGHELATGGPFRLVRNPIYLGLNLLALGTAIWVPTALCWIGAGLMVLGSDLRARAEEKLLRAAFGAAYNEYCARTSRFVPGLY
ncbi:MAG: isoprenylcysteine carboxylmethyltransferase family protein [Gemmatimonadota bacterium]